MHIIGTNKVRFVSLQKNGSTSLRVILKANKSIRGWYTSDQDINHKYPYKEIRHHSQIHRFVGISRQKC